MRFPCGAANAHCVPHQAWHHNNAKSLGFARQSDVGGVDFAMVQISHIGHNAPRTVEQQTVPQNRFPLWQGLLLR